MKIQDLFEAPAAARIWYHGSNVKFNAFDESHLSREEAIHQEGPGFYLTSSIEDAKMYGKYVHAVKVKLAKSRIMPEKRKLNPAFIRATIYKCPDREDALSNWHENPNIALTKAADAIMDAYGPDQYREAMEQLWYDYYKGHEGKWLSRLRGLGWDGFILKRTGGIEHLICFNPEILTVQEVLTFDK